MGNEHDDNKATAVKHVEHAHEASRAHHAEGAGHAKEAPRLHGPSLAEQRARHNGQGPSPASHGADGVSLADDDDGRPSLASTLLGALRGGRDDHDRAVTRPDGTETSHGDGHRITKSPDGKTTDEYSHPTDGSSTRKVTYVRDGANVSETTVTGANGDVRMVSEVEKDGHIDRTTSTTNVLDGAIEDVAPDETRGKAPSLEENLGLEGRVAVDAQRDKIEQTRVVQESIDTTKKPPESRTLLESTAYRQRIPLFRDGDTPQVAPPDSPNPMLASTRGGIVSDVDRDASGLTLAVTRTTTYDRLGLPTHTEQQGATNTLVGRTESGRPVSMTDDTVVTLGNGFPKERNQRPGTTRCLPAWHAGHERHAPEGRVRRPTAGRPHRPPQGRDPEVRVRGSEDGLDGERIRGLCAA